MSPDEIQHVFARLRYERDGRNPPDNLRKGRFRNGWEDAVFRGLDYSEETLRRLTWHNLGYRFGKLVGPRSTDEMDEVYEVLAASYTCPADAQGSSHSDEEAEEGFPCAGGHFDWQAEIRGWCRRRRDVTPELTEAIISFFRLSFENTRCPDRAWFGTHPSGVSLVVGGIYLAAISDQGFWLLVDQGPPQIDGVGYRPVKSTRGSSQPLVWAHAESLLVIPNLVSNAALWASYQAASSKVLTASRAATDRDTVQERREKRRLSDFWDAAPANIFPDEIEPEDGFREGSKRTITVNAYERDEKARTKCLAHFGRRCAVCTFSFGEAYGPIAEQIIHVHHLRPLSEIGEEYTVDPLEDLRPVCPNCHTVLHLRKPIPYSIQELQEFLSGKIIQAVAPNNPLQQTGHATGGESSHIAKPA